MLSLNRDPAQLIMNLSQAAAWRDELRKNKQKLVVTNGCFDLLHRGHAEYMMRAREYGDSLLVLINSDNSVRCLKGPSRPIISEYNRAYMLAALEAVDAVVVFDSPRCTAEFSALSPDVYVKGGDYDINSINTEEKAALTENNTAIKFIPFVDGFSTTSILEKIQKSSDN